MASQHTPSLDSKLCDGCRLCVTACPCGAIAMVDGRPAFRCSDCCNHDENCPVIKLGFHPCEMACPEGAISVVFTISDEG